MPFLQIRTHPLLKIFLLHRNRLPQTCWKDWSCFPSHDPPAIGPPLTKIVGIFTRAAAIRSPGTFLSTVRYHNKSVKLMCHSQCFCRISESDLLVTSEYFIPICPMAIPSQTAIAGTMIGVPPAIALHFDSLCNLIQVHMSRHDLIIRTHNSVSTAGPVLLVSFPSALNRERCGVLLHPLCYSITSHLLSSSFLF